jgi:hypothetical protein
LREHDDHEDLGELAELEGQRADRDPSRGVPDPVPDGERQEEQAELERIDRPRQRLEPPIVESGGQG